MKLCYTWTFLPSSLLSSLSSSSPLISIVLLFSEASRNIMLTQTANIYLIFICSITNHAAQQREKDSGTGRTKLMALTAALRNGKLKTKVVTTSTSK